MANNGYIFQIQRFNETINKINVFDRCDIQYQVYQIGQKPIKSTAMQRACLDTFGITLRHK